MNPIQTKRKDVELTQAELAKKTRLSDRTIQAYEYGKKEPGVKKAIRIADAVGVTTYEEFKELFDSD
jgi:transcriptional regulator with XRE-family HTH domain